MKTYVKKYFFPSLTLALLMLCGALWDLQINTFLYNPKSVLGLFMESFGFLPLYLPIVLFAASLAFDKRRKTALRITGLLLYTAGFVLLMNVAFNHLVKRGISEGALLLPQLAIDAIFIIASVLVFKGLDAATHKKLQFLFGVGCVYMVLNNIVVNVLKLIWQRTRFDDMLMLATGSMEGFTPWYLPFGNGGSSFPSGHTAAACAVFVLVSACALFAKWQGKERLVYAFCWAYVGLMAIGRIIIGRHFLSDTVAAALIGVLIYVIMTKTKLYKKCLANAIK
ncbi:MAG: phosphatase PAP2 family protein [Oscillospiraceae bacterium]